MTDPEYILNVMEAHVERLTSFGQQGPQVDRAKQALQWARNNLKKKPSQDGGGN